MDLEVHGLPSGWRYPMGKRVAREGFRQVSEGFARFEMPPGGSAGLVAQATVTRATRDLPWHAVLHIYGQRDEAYSDQSAAEFRDVVLPQIANFLRDELSQREALVPDPHDLTVRWDETGHHVAITRRHRETWE